MLKSGGRYAMIGGDINKRFGIVMFECLGCENPFVEHELEV